MRYSYFSDTDSMVRSLSIIGNLVSLLEFLIEDCECVDAGIGIYEGFLEEGLFLPTYVCIELKGCKYSEPSVEPRYISILEDSLGCKVRLCCEEGYRDYLSYRELMSLGKDLIKNLTIRYLRPHLLKTKLTSIEYVLLVNRSGELVVLEGERERVSLPMGFKVLENIVATSHTHPHGCFPSHKDLEHLELIMSHGGLGGAILGPTCISLIVRRSMLLIDDVYLLREVIRRIKERNVRGVLGLFNRFKSIEIVMGSI